MATVELDTASDRKHQPAIRHGHTGNRYFNRTGYEHFDTLLKKIRNGSVKDMHALYAATELWRKGLFARTYDKLSVKTFETHQHLARTIKKVFYAECHKLRIMNGSTETVSTWSKFQTKIAATINSLIKAQNFGVSSNPSVGPTDWSRMESLDADFDIEGISQDRTRQDLRSELLGLVSPHLRSEEHTLLMSRSDGEILEDLGRFYGVTKERIRQRIKEIAARIPKDKILQRVFPLENDDGPSAETMLIRRNRETLEALDITLQHLARLHIRLDKKLAAYSSFLQHENSSDAAVREVKRGLLGLRHSLPDHSESVSKLSMRHTTLFENLYPFFFYTDVKKPPIVIPSEMRDEIRTGLTSMNRHLTRYAEQLSSYQSVGGRYTLRQLQRNISTYYQRLLEDPLLHHCNDSM